MRRCHYPLQYILGTWYFRSLVVTIRPPLLIPRFETEYLVGLLIDQVRLRWSKGSMLEMVDYCCGTGVLGLSLLKELSAEYQLKCTFLDLNPKAIALTRLNAQRNSILQSQLQFIQGDMLDHLDLIPHNQVILCNPPYIPNSHYNRMQAQVKLH